MQWLYWTWYYAHHFELSYKDAFLIQLFKDITCKLVPLYYLYAKPPKNSHELTDIVEDLKEVWEFLGGGNPPVISEGSHWINHNLETLPHLVEKYSTFLSKVIILAEDQTIQSTDQAHLKGYLKKWMQSKMLIGAAMYVDMLKALPSPHSSQPESTRRKVWMR